jgi:hypothetical protein
MQILDTGNLIFTQIQVLDERILRGRWRGHDVGSLRGKAAHSQ